MGPESKGRALLGKIYKKLETILVEVDTFTSQNTLCSNSTDPSGWEVGEDLSSDLQQHHDRLALPSCDSPSRQNFDISGAVRVVERVSEDIPKDNSSASSLSVGYTRSSVQSCGVCTNDSKINPTDTKIPDAPVQDNVANMRTSNEGSPDDVTNSKSDVTPLDTKSLSDMAFREDPLYVDDNALYAVRVRTKKLRSFKRKIMDALTAKRRREKEYEQLAIWFGDADMGSDLVREDYAHKEAIDFKSSQVHESDPSASYCENMFASLGLCIVNHLLSLY